MSDTDNNQTPLPPQQSPDDTSNWDTKVSTDPDGDKYIRAIDEE